MGLKDFLFPKDKSNWDQMRDQSKLDTTRYRDVHEAQQLERGQLQKKIKPTSRIIVAIIAGIIVFLSVWFLLSGFSVLWANISNRQLEKQVDQRLYAINRVESGFEDDDPYSFLDKDGNRHTYIFQTFDGSGETAFRQTTKTGRISSDSGYYSAKPDVPVPQWYIDWKAESEREMTEAVMNGQYDKAKLKAAKERFAREKDFKQELWNLTWVKLLIAFLAGLLTYLALYAVLMKNLNAQNLLADTSDINQYENDQHVQLPEEVMRNYDWFPDVGAHSAVSVSSMISHVALENKGIKKVSVSKRHNKNGIDANGDEVFKGDFILNADGEIMFDKLPFFDKEFATDLFKASFMDDTVESLRKWYDATKIPYNPGNQNRDKLKDYDTVADLINNEWEFPYYETQRPAGAYIVDTAPVNTMV